MLNLLTVMESANANYFLLEEKGIRKDLLEDLARRCGFKVVTRKKDGRIQYKLKKVGIPCERLYTREEKTTFNFVDMADLHIGNSQCEEEKIKEALQYAVRQQVDYVFIAGDILNGAYDIERKDLNIFYSRQIEKAYSIFKKFPLDIRVIPGNHEFTLDYCGIRNPLRELERRLKAEVCSFKVYDGYIQDFEIAGVIKRMMHLERFPHQENVFSAVQRLYEFEENGGLKSKCIDGVSRPIKFLECGHIHKTVEFYDSNFKVYISQPGSFLRGQNFNRPLIHVRGEVLDDLRIVRD